MDKKERIKAHDKCVRELRDKGLLPYMDGSFRPKEVILANGDQFTGYTNESKQKIFITENGTILPNKYSYFHKKKLDRLAKNDL